MVYWGLGHDHSETPEEEPCWGWCCRNSEMKAFLTDAGGSVSLMYLTSCPMTGPVPGRREVGCWRGEVAQPKAVAGRPPSRPGS